MFSASFRNALITAVLASAAAAACGDDSNAGGSGAGTNAGAGASGADAPNGGNGAGMIGGGGNGAGMIGGGGSGGDPATGGGGSTTTGGGGEGGQFLCPEMELPVISELPDNLSDTGLYSDILTDTLSTFARPYEPKYPLWSDDADKARWAYVPIECDQQIDTSDMDTWDVPPGTRFWKEFTRDGTRVETRIIVRTGTGDFDYLFGAYVWNEAQTEAVLNDVGVEDALGTPHDVPPKSLCSGCHKKDWRILGFSAIQLTHPSIVANDWTMTSLCDEDVLTVEDQDGSIIPGDATTSAALGVLHANCGNCHYEGGGVQTSMKLRALVGHTTLAQTDVFTTAVNQPSGNMDLCDNCDFIQPGPGGAANSLIAIRMGLRGGGQMPPFATDDVDIIGHGAVTTWIESLPP